MAPDTTGQIVKFHTSILGENPELQYVVLDLYTTDNIEKAKIQALNTGLPFPPINIVKADELEIVAVSTVDLLGHIAYIKKDDGSKILGKIITVEDSKVFPSLMIKDSQVETNVKVSIKDNYGVVHVGKLVVS